MWSTGYENYSDKGYHLLQEIGFLTIILEINLLTHERKTSVGEQDLCVSFSQAFDF